MPDPSKGAAVNRQPPPQAPALKPRTIIGDRGGHFLSRMEGATAANISACYQCERCTNACPVAHFMDVKPHQVLRYVQLGWREELMASTTVWVCLSCEMCSTYCPNEVHVAEVILHLRSMASRAPEPPREPVLAEFHRTFLRELQRFGRVNEFWLMASLNMRPSVLRAKLATGDWKKEAELGWKLLRKGRLRPLPHRCRAIGGIRRLYRHRRKEGL